MAKYNFDELVKKANQGQGLYTKSSEKTEEEAEKNSSADGFYHEYTGWTGNRAWRAV